MAEINIFGTLNNVTGEPIAKASQIKDFTLNKTQAEINQIAMAGGFERVEVDELPTPSSSTVGKLYIVPSPNPQSQNIKDEYVTLIVQNTYHVFDNIIFKPSGTPELPSDISVTTAVLTQESGKAKLKVYTGSTLAATVEPDRGTVAFVRSANIHYVVYDPSSGQSQTASDWKEVSGAYNEYYWELVGSRPEEIEPVSSANDMWKPVVEIFAAATGTAKPTGSVSTVYMRVNREITGHEQWGGYLEIGVLSETCAIEYLGASFTATVSGNKIPASSTRIALTASAATDVTNVPTEFYEGGLTL